MESNRIEGGISRGNDFDFQPSSAYSHREADITTLSGGDLSPSVAMRGDQKIDLGERGIPLLCRNAMDSL